MPKRPSQQNITDHEVSFVRNFFKERFPFWGVVLFLCIAGAVGGGVYWSILFFAEPPLQSRAAVIPPRERRALDGVWVRPGEENILPVSIVVENFIDARPPSGLSKASIIFEAPVEAGITRFLAVYGVREGDFPIGPVRSLRPYFLTLAQDVGALLAHVGGSPAALTEVAREYHRFDVNEFFAGHIFWRSADRSAPHNVYTTLSLLRSLLVERGLPREWDESSLWEFHDDPDPASRPEISQRIELDFSTGPYRVVWKYDRTENIYMRFHGMSPHLEDDGTHLAAKNIILIPRPVQILDDVGRRAIPLFGTGDAIAFRDGERFSIRWEKDEETRLHFFHDDGSPFSFTAGQTWVEIFPQQRTVWYNGEEEIFNL